MRAARRRGGLFLWLALAVVAPPAGPAAAEPLVPSGAWGLEGYPEILSIHEKNGLTAVARLEGITGGAPVAPWQFAVGQVLADGTGFEAALVNPATLQGSGKLLRLTFKPTNPSRLSGAIIDQASGTIDRQFTAGKLFPVSAYAVLAFGDSITLGVGAGSSGGYPDILKGLLQARGLAFDVTNAGVGGETVYGGDARLPGTLDGSPITPGITLLLEGINGLDDSPESIEGTVGALLSMVAAARARGSLPVLGTLTPVAPSNGREAAVEQLNTRIRQVAVENGILLADHFAAFAGDLALLTSDGLHPNDQGYERMAQTWLGAILSAQ